MSTSRHYSVESRPGPGLAKLGKPIPYIPKRGRPTAKQVAAINHAILTAAANHFLVDGFDGSSMEAIAADAGVSKGTLYSRYPHKEALLKAFVEDRINIWSIARHNGKVRDDLKSRLKHHAETVLIRGISPEIRALDRLLMGTSGRPREALRVLYEAGYRGMLAIFEADIQECSGREGAPAADPRRVARLLMATLTGWFRVEHAERTVSRAEAIRFAHYAVDVLMAGRDSW